MSRINIEDLPAVEELSEEEAEGIFGGWGFSTSRYSSRFAVREKEVLAPTNQFSGIAYSTYSSYPRVIGIVVRF